jgi:prepilin-type N-terminal cleavage/methylation domain-containing protein
MNTQQNRPQKKRFSLIELLIVIAIIGILMGILLPVFVGMRDKGKIQRARQEMAAIEMAIKAYEATYGILPNIGFGDADKILEAGSPEKDVKNSEYDKLMDVLTNVNRTGGANMNSNNTRGIRFLDVPVTYATNGYVDPWGSKYRVAMDLNYDKKVDPPDLHESPLYGTVFIYSLGPPNKDPRSANPVDEKGRFWDGKTGDFPSWRTQR